VKFKVDLDRCENHGQCTYSAPDVFSLDGEGKLSFREGAGSEYVSPVVDSDLEEDVEEASDVCPVLAISLLDD
jgi:ferredoxin